MVMTESNRSPSCRPAAWDGEGAAVGAVLDAAVGDGVADSMSDADPASSDSALFPQALIIVSSRADIKIRDNMNRMLSENTGQPLEKIEKDVDRDNFMSSYEAAEYGLIDRVLEPR